MIDMKKSLILFIVFVLLFMSACSDKLSSNEIDNLKSYTTKTMLESDHYNLYLNNIINTGTFSYEPYLDDLKQNFKLLNRPQQHYYLMKLSDPDGILVAFYEEQEELGLRFEGSLYFTKLFKESDFSQIKVGQSTVDDVKKIDPNIPTIDLERGNSSVHPLKNGETLVITYDEQGKGIVRFIEIDELHWDDVLNKNDKAYILKHFK